MVISHRYKYLFVELPRTGSTAIARELCVCYDGVKILHKHSTYDDFLRMASAKERTYFVFSCIRNPLDATASLYFKYKTDHRQQFSQDKNTHSRVLRWFSQRQFNFVQNTNVDFSTYFMRFYKVPYNNWSSLSHERFDYVIRFENIQNGFSEALRLIGIEQVRPLPSSNRTGGREEEFLSYYTPETIARAKWVFGPFMEKWVYEFPPAWGDEPVPWLSWMEFRFFNLFRTTYWKYLRDRVPFF